MAVILAFHVTAVSYPHQHLMMSVLLFDILMDTYITVLQKIGNYAHTCMYTCTCKEIGAEKSHSLMSANWKSGCAVVFTGIAVASISV